MASIRGYCTEWDPASSDLVRRSRFSNVQLASRRGGLFESQSVGEVLQITMTHELQCRSYCLCSSPSDIPLVLPLDQRVSPKHTHTHPLSSKLLAGSFPSSPFTRCFASVLLRFFPQTTRSLGLTHHSANRQTLCTSSTNPINYQQTARWSKRQESFESQQRRHCTPVLLTPSFG